jgi:hypothetical protein
MFELVDYDAARLIHPTLKTHRAEQLTACIKNGGTKKKRRPEKVAVHGF